MSRFEKLLDQILKGTSDTNIRFEEICNLLSKLGFSNRIKGSHHIFFKEKIIEIINIQPTREGKCKPYQVKQIRDLIVKYKLSEFIN